MGAVFRRDLLSYFKNAIGYFVVGVYCLITGVMFVITVIGSAETNASEYFGTWVYFANVILVSLLSFRFFSEEKKNRTDQLLLTSPVKISSLVFGKYFAAAVIYAGCTLINVLYMTILSFFGEVYWSEFVMQMFGSLLIGCAMIAVGLFISSVTESQIATVAATFGSLLFMYVINRIAVILPANVALVLNALNLYANYTHFAIGLLNPVPIVYYLSVAGVFLFLTVRFIEKRRWL